MLELCNSVLLLYVIVIGRSPTMILLASKVGILQHHFSDLQFHGRCNLRERTCQRHVSKYRAMYALHCMYHSVVNHLQLHFQTLVVGCEGTP